MLLSSIKNGEFGQQTIGLGDTQWSWGAYSLQYWDMLTAMSSGGKAWGWLFIKWLTRSM